MTPLQFESLHAAEWLRLEEQVALYLGRRRDKATTLPAHRVTALYRKVCEHLALARERGYPAHLTARLERVTADAHQLIYQQRDPGFAGLRAFLLHGFPAAVRRHRLYVLVATVLLMGPTLVTGWVVYQRPELILSVVDASAASDFEQMYSGTSDAIGRRRAADSNWSMFGYYIRNNIGVAFRCFAGGLLFGLGSVFFLVYNGAFGGAVAGFLTARDLGATFYGFVVTHAAFELTAIVLAGAAGLRLGHALVSPGRLTRRMSLVQAARETTPMLYGLTAMLLIAAVIEAFWSSQPWLPAPMRYGVAALCWSCVLGYFLFQGRRAD